MSDVRRIGSAKHEDKEAANLFDDQTMSIFADTNSNQMQMLLFPTPIIKAAVKYISQVVKSLKALGGSDIAAR